MTTRRTYILMAALLALIGLYVFQYGPLQQLFESGQPARLSGSPEVTGLKAEQLPNGRWQLDFDYFYPGQAVGAWYRVKQTAAGDGPAQQPTPSLHIDARPAKQGRHHVQMELRRPEEHLRFTRAINVELFEGQEKVTSQQLAVSIEWPSYEVMRINEMAASGRPEQVVIAQALKIDTNRPDQLREARQVLERLLLKHPQTDAAYIELARVAMKTKWGPEGLSQAEDLLDAARQIRPDNPNRTILLGYVYAHQKRYKEAEPLFVEASKALTPNLWLWFNWGELLEMQGKASAAAEKYKQAIASPPKDDTYDRARRAAFERLIQIAHQRQDLDTAEALHRQRTADYGMQQCYGPAYARFMLYQRLDAKAALALGRQIAEVPCPAEDVNEIMGVAKYMMWAAGKEPERAEMLREARVQFPVGPRLYYQLASTDKTLEVARQLVATGNKVDQIDNRHFNALAYALQARELATARRLIRIGARPDTPVGPEEMPVALICVVSRDLEGIKLMQHAGANYAKLKFRGFTAVDHARQTGDKQLLEVLDPKGKSL